MKLTKIENLGNYYFNLGFDNNSFCKFNIKSLIENKVSINDLKAAQLNKEWDCLEFKDGIIDIKPKTLYNFCFKQN